MMEGGAMGLYILGGVLLLVAIWCMGNYNRLIRLSNACDESWSDIDTELKRRYNLIPNLVEVVKGYAAHERDTLTEVMEARGRAVASTGSPGSQARDENTLVGALNRLLFVSEKYPDLKASDQFLKLQQELTNTEDRIQASRRIYNANIRDLNNRIEMFPSALIAMLFCFESRDFFEVENIAVRQAPQVKI